jgi:predicted DNA-binding transcriptional regulator
VISPKKGYLHVVANNKTMFVIKEIEHPVEQWLEIIEKSLKDKNK